MSGPVESPHWYRVAGLHPRLRRQLRVQRRPSRGAVWYVVEDPATGQHHRFNEAAWRIAGRFDGQSTVQQVWATARALHGDATPTQHEVLLLLAQLDAAGLVHCERLPDIGDLLRRGAQRRRSARRGAVNPLAFRVPLHDPSGWLAPLAGLGRMLFGTPALLLWLAVTLTAAVAAAMHAGELRAWAGLHMGTPRHLLLVWLCYPVVKAVHELGHALAVRAFGGEVHEAGITLLLLMPVPYVDASASNGFPRRRHRMLVAAAGILAELLLASIGFVVWLTAQDGLVRDAAFVVAAIGSVSTLLVNGNPLMRFDGYYLLCDALDLPNLAPRSRAWLRALLQRHVLGLREQPMPPHGRGEAPWLALYGVASAVYRVLVVALVVGWLASHSLALGVLAGAWGVFELAWRPAVRLLRFLREDPRLARRRLRASATVAAGFALLVGLVALLPLPQATRAEGVVTVPEGAQLRAGTDGFVAELLAADGEAVRRGQPVLRLADPALIAERASVASRLVALDVGWQQALFTTPSRAQQLAAEAERLQGDLARLDERVAQLELRAPADGTLVLPAARDLPSRFAARGTVLGYVLTGEPVALRVPVSEDDVDLVRRQTREVAVRFADAPARPRHATLLREVPAAAERLPSRALGDRGGGAWVTDPSDADGLRTLAPVFVVDLTVPGTVVERIGGRAWVRFDHGSAPLAAQAWRRARQVFLRLTDAA